MLSWIQALYGSLGISGVHLVGRNGRLITHMHLINQLSRELGGTQWSKYDFDYCEWAAAIRKWGDLNFVWTLTF